MLSEFKNSNSVFTGLLEEDFNFSNVLIFLYDKHYKKKNTVKLKEKYLRIHILYGKYIFVWRIHILYGYLKLVIWLQERTSYLNVIF